MPRRMAWSRQRRYRGQHLPFAVKGMHRPVQIGTKLDAAGIEINPLLSFGGLCLCVIVEPVVDFRLMDVDPRVGKKLASGCRVRESI